MVLSSRFMIWLENDFYDCIVLQPDCNSGKSLRLDSPQSTKFKYKLSWKLGMSHFKTFAELHFEWGNFFRSQAFMWKGSLEVTFFPSVHPSTNFTKFIFLVNYNCDASYDHLWCPNGPEVNQKWTGSDRKWTGSAIHPSFHPSVILSVCPSRSGLEVSVCPSVPNISLTSLTNLMRGNYKHRALAPCDFSPKNLLRL